jgi:hypothetical protein
MDGARVYITLFLDDGPATIATIVGEQGVQSQMVLPPGRDSHSESHRAAHWHIDSDARNDTMIPPMNECFLLGIMDRLFTIAGYLTLLDVARLEIALTNKQLRRALANSNDSSTLASTLGLSTQHPITNHEPHTYNLLARIEVMRWICRRHFRVIAAFLRRVIRVL